MLAEIKKTVLMTTEKACFSLNNKDSFPMGLRVYAALSRPDGLLYPLLFLSRGLLVLPARLDKVRLGRSSNIEHLHFTVVLIPPWHDNIYST